MKNGLLTTVSGRPVTVPVSTRVDILQYQQLRSLAEKGGQNVSSLLKTWIAEKLEQRHER